MASLDSLSSAGSASGSGTRPGVMRRLVKNRSALIGGSLVLIFVLMALLAPVLPLADPFKSNFLAIRKPPSELYWFGTDELGRDQVARLFFGARASLLAGIVSVLIALAIGIPFGLLAGWYGGWIDIVISRFTEAMLACPFLILAIAFAAVLGPSLTNAMIAIGLSAVPIFIRLVRGQVMSVKAEDFVEGARAVGARDLRADVPPCAAEHPVPHRGAVELCSWRRRSSWKPRSPSSASASSRRERRPGARC